MGQRPSNYCKMGSHYIADRCARHNLDMLLSNLGRIDAHQHWLAEGYVSLNKLILDCSPSGNPMASSVAELPDALMSSLFII